MLTYTFRVKRKKARTGGKNESMEERRTRDGKLARQEAAVSGVRDDILMMNLFPKEKQAGARLVADWWGCGVEFSVHDRMNEKSSRGGSQSAGASCLASFYLAGFSQTRECRFSFFITRRDLIGGCGQSRYVLLRFHEIVTIEWVYENDRVVRR